ncbi:helix-turn-helix domain-containing protein [Sphaerisporangium sp. NPDC051017]|uniref:helix-turn-helix transcriptional regulator n=1 Tax=Sphaerisporangium sp. NPDC051017 TaxID=3154636 RepID=UPI00342C0B43
MAEKHLGPEELADRVGVTVQTVYYWNKVGSGPRFMKIGRHCRYRLADVLAWEESRYADGAAR